MASYLPGDVVGTSFGVGVLISCPKAENYDDKIYPCFTVSLWRVPGQSAGSCSTAHLQSDAILGKLPVAPGMITWRKVGEEEEQVMVYAYYSSTNTFLVSTWSEVELTTPPLFEVPVDEMQTASSAKFYPLLYELMRRGDMTAKETTNLLQDEKVAKVVEKSTKLIESSGDEAETMISKANVDHLTDTVKESVPDADSMNEVITMLKDEELTVLLQKGQERLQQLVSNDVPEATQLALGKAGIVIADGDDVTSTFTETLSKSRETALASLEELLKEVDVDKNDLYVIREKLEENFTTMFDSLSEAAHSDRTLSTIFDTISGKTTYWQEATGRLLSTKSGSLFMEGANRLRERAVNMFSQGQLDWAGEVGSQLTKAFTEGDAAVARLKSLELGDAVRVRLVAAIEVRSGSYGGLDGIIAGALTTVTEGGEAGGDQIQSMLASLRKTASTATTDAHETLISVLARRNEYQDVALLRIERVLCDLESHLSDDLTPEEIAAIARGDGGTAAIFEPIAKRATQEIEKLLDQTESSVTDPTILSGLKHVRKLLSGDLSMNGLMDELVDMLNNEQVVSAGESIVQSGESVLDAIEGMSGNKVVGDVMEIAEKAGITKEALMTQMEQLNVDELLDTAGNAVTDEKARKDLVSSATDTALEFILRILPSMPVPPFDGVREGLVYHLSNLSMEGFKVKKDNIVVEIAGMRATKKPPTPKQPVNIENDFGEIPEIQAQLSTDSTDVLEPIEAYDQKSEAAKATELLIIDVKRISASLDDAVWKFEQTYMPYLKGDGKANVKLSDGSIRLQFELRKRRKLQEERTDTEDSGDEWEPVLCLHDRNCTIEHVELQLQGEGKLTWIVNKLATIFQGPLRDYVVRTIINTLTNHSGYILEQLNQNLVPYWGLILRTTGLQLDSLVETDERVITAAVPKEDEDLIELVWREPLPLGMNLLLNDESGLLKVVDFPRGSQARAVCAEKDLDPVVFNGATIIGVNGRKYDVQDELFEALKDSSRPKSIQFRLANSEDAERVKNFVGKASAKKKEQEIDEAPREFSVREVTFVESRELGIEFVSTNDDFGLAVKSFVPGPDGIVLAAEREDNIRIGDLLCKVNDELVIGETGAGKQRALELLEKYGSERPLRLSFTEPYLYRDVFEKNDHDVSEMGGPDEFVLEETKSESLNRVAVKGFTEVSGAAELGGLLIGDHLVFVNGLPVGAGCNLFGTKAAPDMSEVDKMLRDEAMYPIALTFARPQKTENRWSSHHGAGAQPRGFEIEAADTICIAADSYDQLGCVFEDQAHSDIVLSDIVAVSGPIKKRMSRFQDSHGKVCLSIEAVNGQFVPSYASTHIVKNAMKRSWSTEGKVEIQFCDDERKEWLYSIVNHKS